MGAHEMRRLYPDLSEAELGAAVTFNDPQPDHAFSAEWEGPPRRRFWISGCPGDWAFGYDDISETGAAEPGWDVWEAAFAEIIRYPEVYGDRAMNWRDKSGVAVDIYSLSFAEEP